MYHQSKSRLEKFDLSTPRISQISNSLKLEHYITQKKLHPLSTLLSELLPLQLFS